MKDESLRLIWLRKVAQAASCLTLVVTLAGCGANDTPTTSTADGSTVAASPSVSAAALNNDDTNSLSFAHGVAAGVIDVTDAVVPSAQAGGIATATLDSGSQSATPVIGAAVSLTGEPLAVAPAPNGAESNNERPAVIEGSDSAAVDQESANSAEAVPVATADSETEILVATENNNPSPDTEANTAPAEVAIDNNGNDNATSNTLGSRFSSLTTDGFAGELRADGTVRVTWQKDPTARGYNVYRQAKYVQTVFTEEYIDNDTFDENYYYEIQAFDYNENYKYVATGLTVKARGLGRINPASPKPKANLLDDYELVFSEEFNGSELDTSKWNTSYLWGADLVINSEEQYYVDIANEPNFGFNPFEMDGETLTIKSIRTPDNLRAKANNQPYLSGVITSYDSFKFTYGYVEARAKVIFGQGYWPAFWLLNAYYVDDKPEIDIMEHIGNDQDVVYHTYHYHDAEGNLRSSKSKPTPGIDFTSEFHTYAVEWMPGTIIFYVDGIERHRITDPKVSQQDMYIIANTALGGWWPGSPNETTPFPGEYKIDYIRAYQKIGPYADQPLNDTYSQLPLAKDVPNTSPNHLPPFELWPEGYPER